MIGHKGIVNLLSRHWISLEDALNALVASNFLRLLGTGVSLDISVHLVHHGLALLTEHG